MTHNEVYKLFELCVPMCGDRVELWFPNGKNSIRVRYVRGYECIFTGTSTKDWMFETKDHFIKRLKEKK